MQAEHALLSLEAYEGYGLTEVRLLGERVRVGVWVRVRVRGLGLLM